MHIPRSLILVLFLAALTACGSAAPTSAPAPSPSTAAATPVPSPAPAEPTVAPTAEVVDVLSGTTWQWVKLTDPMQQVEIDNPAGYTIAFSNGTVNIKADCNQASGSYTPGADGVLAIAPGPTTLALCLPGSRGEEFLQKLGQVARYFFQDDRLFLELPADGGTLEFMRFEEGAMTETSDALSGTTWQWVRLTDPTQQVDIDQPADYTIAFSVDELSIKADCNQASATYSSGKNGVLTITVGPSTRVACPPGSRGDQFLKLLGAVTRYSFQNDRLLLELPVDGGTLEFARP